MAGRGLISTGLLRRVAHGAHRLAAAALFNTAKFDSAVNRVRLHAAAVSVVPNGGVWNTPGNWFCVTGGTPVFQRLQTPPFFVHAAARAARDGN